MAYIISSGITSDGVILKNDSMTVLDGGTAQNTTGLINARIKVSSGGIISNTTFISAGNIDVSSGGKAINTTTENDAYMYVSNGAFVTSTVVNSNSYLRCAGTANNVMVNQGGTFNLYSGGVAINIIENGGYVDVNSNAIATFVSNAFSGLVLTGTNHGTSASIHSGTTATNTTLNNGGNLYVFDGGVCSCTTINLGGKLYISSGGLANETDILGDEAWGGSGYLYISSGGTANRTTVFNGGSLHIYSGGTANNTTVSNGGRVQIRGGVLAKSIIMAGGSLNVSSGGKATEVVENGGFVNVEAGADVSFESHTFSGLVLLNDASIHSKTIASKTRISAGNLHVFSGGLANETTIYGKGGLIVSSGGIVDSVKTYAGGNLSISSGGSITGKMSFLPGAIFSVEDGAVINFDLARTTAGAKALLSDWSLVQGLPDYTLTVKDNQETGIYKLAGVADEFDGTITVQNDLGKSLGVLAIGQSLVIGEYTYLLTIDDDTLLLNIAGSSTPPTVPEKPVAMADITTPTNGDVLVTATFSEDSVIKEYSLDGENWGAYVGGVLFSSNRTAYFRGIDAAGNSSDIESYTVTNIDRTAPAKPSVSVDVTTPTNQSMSVSATFDEDSSTKEYSFDGEDWHPYTKTLLLIKNETVSFRGTDEAGNTSEVASLEVNNIDTVAPTDPTGLMTIVSDQTVVLIWNASTDDYSGVKEYVVKYSLDGQESIVLRTNGTSLVLNNADCGSYSWSVQAIDLAGNESALIAGDAFTVSGFKPYTVEYSEDNFEHVITFAVTTPSLDAFRIPTGTYQLRVKQDGSSEWMTGDSIVAPESDIEPQLIKSDADGNADVFFANAVGTWESGYLAQHVGSTADTWGGTKEYATLFGKNKLADIIEGSTDANILLMTDDDNGDTLFVDDIYTASPGDVAEKQSRIAQIDEIRAGAGADIVDMTSQRFEYTGDGLTIRGGEGNDTIWANKGDNFLFGDAGNDRIVGASGNDVIAGGIGNDRLHGGGGEDVFTFCDNWGSDNVEQLSGGSVTLWFTSGSETNWNAETMTYSDGTNSVKVSGVSEVRLKFGDDGSAQFASLTNMGAFFDATTERIFEESGKGILASL